jgi:hypothetical protein
MRSSLHVTALALLCCVVHGFSSPIPVNFSTRSVTSNVPVPKVDGMSKLRIISRGGAGRIAATPLSTGSKCPATGAATIAASLWGAGGVIYILAKAIKRVIPIALEPFQAGSIPLSNFQLGYDLVLSWYG